MSMNEEHPARLGSHFPEAAFMIQSDESGCVAVSFRWFEIWKPSPCRKAQFWLWHIAQISVSLRSL